MNKNEMQEHIFKESLKRQVDNNPNFSDQMKWDIKASIDACKTLEEIATVMSLYSLMFHRR